MKKLLLLLVLLGPLMVSAQSGSITYEQVVKIDIELPPEMESMRAQIPTESKTSKILYFNEMASLMKAAPVDESKKDVRAQREGMMIRMMTAGQTESETYLNLEEGLVTEKREFMGRTFLIGGEQPTYAWKLTGEQSEYMGYPVQKATAVKDSTSIEAWFSSEIPVSAGPELFTGLPGMILVLSIDGGKLQYAAKIINLDDLSGDQIKAPVDGKKITRAEFDKVVEEKTKELQSQFGGRGGNVTRIIRH